jgi:ABC-type bacteriocin/lantibiotic exporter with double-glycine peptidase domain
MSGWAKPLFPFLLVCGTALAAEPPGIWLDVPFVKQEKNGCGAASVAMVMQYWHREQPGQPAIPNPDEIQRSLFSRRAHGIYASDLERYLQQHGYRKFAIHGEWSDLRQHLEKGRPLIVALHSGHDDFHYVVVTGLEWQQEMVLKHDPAERQLIKQHRPDFEREWKATGNWTLVAVPKEDAVPRQKAVPAGEAALDHEGAPSRERQSSSP